MPSPRGKARRAVPRAPDAPLAEAAPAGTAVGSFVLGDVVEHDDFRLCYRARATASDADVLIEEYWPKALVQRGDDGDAKLREANFAELYEAGLRAFIAESETLAALEHRSLVRIGPMWLARATAYRLRVDTATLRLSRHLEGRPRPVDEAWLRGLAEPLLGALACVHGAERVHGNVRPGAIALRADGAPLLLDFDAARNAIAGLAPWRGVAPEPGYAAPELALYGVVPTPAADLYSLAAVLWFCSTGEAPEAAVAGQPVALSRWQGVLARHPSLRYSPGWMAALERALAFDPAVRPQDAQAFRRLLAAEPTAPSVLEAVRTAPTLTDPVRTGPSLAEDDWPTFDAQPAQPVRAARPAPKVVEPMADWPVHSVEPVAARGSRAAAGPSRGERGADPRMEARARPPAPVVPPPQAGVARPFEPPQARAPFVPVEPLRPAAVEPVDPPYLHAAVDDSEPAWQLPIFSGVEPSAPVRVEPSAMRVEPSDWPTSDRTPLFDGPAEPHGRSRIDERLGPTDSGVPWVRRPAAPPPKRHWPWAVGGALIGGAAMLAFGLGSERGLDGFPFAAWLGLTPSVAAAGGTVPPTVTSEIDSMQRVAPPAAGTPAAVAATGGDQSPRAAAATQPASPYPLPPAGAAQEATRPGATATPAAPVTASKTAAPTAARPDSTRRSTAAVEPARSASEDLDPTRGVESRREAAASLLDPAAACAPRSNFALYWCMKTQCDRTVNYTHPQCVALRREDAPPNDR